MALTIILADHHTEFRQQLRSHLDRQQHIQVIAEVKNGADAVNLSRLLSPDLMLIDLSLPELSGIETARQISTKQPWVHVLALSLSPEPEYVAAMLMAGAKGYALKSDGCAEILKAIGTVAEGRTYVSPAVSGLSNLVAPGQPVSLSSEI
jgi:two-component system NarL family response regulator